jgi:hypothetical protein
VGDIFDTKRINHIKPELRDYTDEVKATPFISDIHVLPSRILTYMPNEEREKLVWTLHTFARLHNISSTDNSLQNEVERVKALLEAIRVLKSEALQAEDYHELTKLRSRELAIHRSISEMIDTYTRKLP